MQGFVRVPLNDIAALEQVAATRPNVTAVFLEAIQGEGGIQPAQAEYLRQTRALCDRKGWLLMIDEVQCGTGRTGKWFAHQWSGIKPDVMPLAKGVSSGIPVGAVVAHGIASETFKPGNHGTTFGGNPLAMRAGLTTIEVMEEEGLLANATAGGTTQLGRDLTGITQTFVRRGLVVVISDFFTEEESTIELLRQLHGPGQDVLLSHLLAPEE